MDAGEKALRALNLDAVPDDGNMPVLEVRSLLLLSEGTLLPCTADPMSAVELMKQEPYAVASIETFMHGGWHKVPVRCGNVIAALPPEPA